MKNLTLIIIIFISQISFSQYDVNRHYAGPSLGLSFLGSTFQFGGNYEYALQVQDFGKIGIGGIIRYWSYSETFFAGKWSYQDVLIGLQGNYHFNINNEKIDPWGGLVLAYDAGSVDWTGPASVFYPEPSYGGFWMGFHGGVRYWFQPNIALSGRISFGTLSYGALEVGVDFKL